MSRIDDLIAKNCPDGVTFKRLGDIARIKNGKDHKSLDKGNIPVYGSGGIMRHVNTYAYDKPSVLIPRKGSLGNLFYVDVPFWNVDTIFYTEIDDSQVLPKFLYYFLTTAGLGEMNQAGGVPSQTQSVLNELKIPVPPLEIQREIVRVLDSFATLETELKAELEAELEARRRQYQYYRDALLTFGERTDADASKQASKIRLKPLGEIAIIVRGASPRPIHSFLTEAKDGVPWIKIGDVAKGGKYITETTERVTEAGAVKSRRVHPGDFVLSNSMSFGRPYILKIEGCIHDGWLSISGFNDSFVPDYLYHLLRSTPVQTQFARRAGAGTVQNLNADIVKSISVPVPPIEEQERIVSILDKFDALVNDLSSGLPAEIRARRQQYEYYRDRLLGFREAA